jgi:hypothetical protein
VNTSHSAHGFPYLITASPVCESRCFPLLRLLLRLLAFRFEQLWQRYQAGPINTGTAGLFQRRRDFLTAVQDTYFR